VAQQSICFGLPCTPLPTITPDNRGHILIEFYYYY